MRTKELTPAAFYEQQKVMARRVVAEKGLDALYSPHAMTGKDCGCKDCFCCAALDVFNEAGESPKIYWRDLDSSMSILFSGGSYTTRGGSLIYWLGHESAEAMTTIDDMMAERSAAR